jgi:diguanylate cyclase (GGDEF)-like protein/PAS domain S-box-containing protein
VAVPVMERAGNDAATTPGRLDGATSASLVQQLFDHSPIGMAVLDPSGRMVDVNPAMAMFLQRPRHDLLQLGLVDVTHPADVTVDLGLQHELLAGTRDSYRLQKRFVRMDGTVAWGDLSVSAVCDEYGTPCRLIAQVADITAEREHQDELAERSSSDPLTGLANRATVLTLLGHALRLPDAVGTLAVLYVDLDGFKELNDTLGHAAGDHLLTVMADRMVEIVGRVGVVGRMGGDEFVVVVDEAEGPDEVEELAGTLRRELAGDVAVQGSQCRVTVSIGVAFPHRGLDDPEELVRAADTAMSRAKLAGKDRWERFEHPAPVEPDEAARLEEALGAGDVQGRVVPWFQPIVELATGTVVGHEALVRWQHPDRGVLRPAQFMPAAEDRGLSARVDDAVLAHACAFLAAAGPDAGFVSVNLSLASVLRVELADRVRRALEAHQVDPSRLVVELTEAVTLQLPRHARRDLEALDAEGVRVFVDDFGTGYGALSVFDEVPVRGVKLDRGLIASSGTASPDGHADRLLVGLRHLADGLGLMGVVEGIETDEELQRVEAMGWSHGQGYLLGAPSPVTTA